MNGPATEDDDREERGVLYEKLASHLKHKIVIANYANGANLAIECERCGEVIIDVNREDT